MQHPARAVSALGDISADRAHLLIGGRDILSRPEWRELLTAGQASPTIRAINSSQIQSWISATFSASTAAPWLEALQNLTGHQASLQQQNSAVATGGRGPLAGYLAIAIGCALLMGLAIAFIQQPWKGSSPAAAPVNPATTDQQPLAGESSRPTGRDTASPGQGNGGSADGSAISTAPQGNSDGPPTASGRSEATGSNTASGRGEGGSGNATRTMPGPGRSPSAVTNANPGSRNPGASGRREVLFPESGATSPTTRAMQRHQWPQLQASLENGETRPNDWLIPEAQGRLSHWIQRLDWRGGVLTIRLRTHEAVSPATCKTISQLYQRQFSNGQAGASVLIESSRHAGKDSVSGFLPICRLNAGGNFSQLS